MGNVSYGSVRRFDTYPDLGLVVKLYVNSYEGESVRALIHCTLRVLVIKCEKLGRTCHIFVCNRAQNQSPSDDSPYIFTSARRLRPEVSGTGSG